MNKKLTIFTPTYNRAHLLPALYESLKNQTDKNFVWLIVDDGSTDNTKNLVETWVKEAVIDISYYYKENGGKHTAIDYSNKICSTEFIACVDSDDKLTQNCVEKLLSYLPLASNSNIVGLVLRRAHFNLTPFSENWPLNNTELYFYELSKTYKYTFDTFLVFKTQIIKKYKFPIFNGENFVTESVFYNQFLYDYKFIALNDILYLAEYMPDGYTQMGLDLFRKNPQGYLYALKQNAYIAININKQSFKRRLGLSASYYAWKKLHGLKDERKNEYKLGFLYSILGRILAFKVMPSYK